MRVRFDTEAKGLEMIVGPLEAQILMVLWEAPKPLTNQQILRALVRKNINRGLATITTTTKRLAGKKLIFESTPHNIYVYAPSVTENELIDCVIERVLGSLIVTWPEHLETYLGSLVPAEDLVDKVVGASK